jgi:ABC-2 type transport system ATP-binding protein
MTVEAVLAVREVVKQFRGVRAVDGVSFEVHRGTITGLLGRNGAGKTTTIRMVTGIFHPDRGSIEALGSPAGALAVRDRIGYLPEERGLYKTMKVLDHLLFLGEIKGRRHAETKAVAERWLRRLELWERRDAKIEELSKGNQQKVQLVGALVHGPELLVLDEPMSGLDPVNVVVVRRILAELKAEGRTILLSTHMMELAENMADEVVLIHDGRVVLSGDLDVVRRAHGHNTVHLEFDGDGGFLARIPGVERVALQTNAAEVVLASGGDPQALLAAAMLHLRIRRFEVASPSLEQIFVEKVGTASMRPPPAARAEPSLEPVS